MKKYLFIKKNLPFILVVLILGVYSRIFFIFFLDKNSGQELNKSSKLLTSRITEKITGLDFIKMNKGSFYMGSPQGEEGRKSDESPLTRIEIEEFMISETEVRVKDFSLFVSDTNFITSAEKDGFSYVYSGLTGNWEKKKGISWKNPGFKQTDDHPVVHVSFFDASEFAAWLDMKNQKFKIRLPSEDEWEYAAKKGSIGTFNENQSICSFANCADITAREAFSGWKISDCLDGYVFTSPVKTFLPDKSGLFDMTGNVWEWCNSEYQPFISRKSSRIYGKKQNVVIRGGSFYSKPEFLRNSAREHLSSGTKRAYDIGFRLVITPK